MRLVDLGGRQVELHIRRSNRVKGHRIVVRYGLPPELVVRPRASNEQIDEAIDFHRAWLERQLAKKIEPKLGLDRLRLTEKQGRLEARARITLLAQSEAAALGVTFSRITLRDQVTRWGSCSSKGALSFNWRLVLAPHDVLDYVVVHEVCHLVELNHGPRFWKLLERRRPDYRASKAWLDEHGWEILAYQPPLEAAA
ncbi:MAG TPA: M48 family metallopeptidase [Gaiellaceae bacterium]|nr:M48 family metallopeptidase [Gaiellaceae bacterium]